jgi:hypothetical protein
LAMAGGALAESLAGDGRCVDWMHCPSALRLESGGGMQAQILEPQRWTFCAGSRDPAPAQQKQGGREQVTVCQLGVVGHRPGVGMEICCLLLASKGGDVWRPRSPSI